ncbi:hypothetical protein BU24DRAFT_422438 [Aaosphaeria arxii CBS 175.79]|uniref:Uncharacterized protein n=1 Tax=Aaosphaeria arxii CBS 175.79 TaxID=1450172 RepID=A0A6A5XTQ7_9PLEO|nr:uncharacterized protein BU24DRAFT_422438 [Aaosphaeria arxii CBS 175.79]KAF2016101.1 hypothetical protein BU24DRAFT_422438 [Aaosphaeria arxii CBS 175.79]
MCASVTAVSDIDYSIPIYIATSNFVRSRSYKGAKVAGGGCRSVQVAVAVHAIRLPTLGTYATLLQRARCCNSWCAVVSFGLVHLLTNLHSPYSLGRPGSSDVSGRLLLCIIIIGIIIIIYPTQLCI